MSDYILRMEHITKTFSGVKALDDVTFNVERGHVHALIGENGAGKSTMMKVLCGTWQHGTYDGKVILNDQEQKFHNVKESTKAGIAIIFQELTLVKSMSICENIFLGDEIKKNGIIQWNEQKKITRELLEKVHLDLKPEMIVGELGAGQQQLVEIAKALNKNPKLLILDEPTSSLADADVENLMRIIRELKAEGTTCIYISHKLNEIFEIADTATIIRDGKSIITAKVSELTENEIVSYMVGRDLNQRFPRKNHTPGETVFEIKNWTVMNPEYADHVLCSNVNLKARKGEILGIAGLMGAGRTELALSIFGYYHAEPGGEMYLNGNKLQVASPDKAIEAGIAYVSEDRKQYGLVLESDIKTNMSMASLKKLCSRGVIQTNEETKRTLRYVDLMRVKATSLKQPVKALSGGNQQKVVIGKWLMTEPKVLILDEPTRGIDVGAKLEIYNEMNSLVEEGVCIIMISSELPEILGMSDRIYVMSEGRITGEFDIKEATQEKIMAAAIGGGEV
ncbi:MAG: ATP-binding cassette domain-containing protein [Candidatus Choladocola sp.]|nr:ATP-binding cassette domain-containing protein [Candidatus Choladocola sp.]